MRFFSGVTLAKLDPNLGKIEISKFSLGIITSEGVDVFPDWVISLGLLDTEVDLDSSILLNVSFLFFLEVVDALTLLLLFLMEVIDA